MDRRSVFKELVKKIAEGDKDALTSAVSMAAYKVRRIAMQVLADSGLCEDVLSEVIIKLWERAPKLAKLKNPLGYIYVSAYNLAVDYGRRRREIPLQEGITAADEGGTGAAELNIALSGLPGELREILLLKAAYGFNFREIAKITGMTHRQVYTRYQKAAEQLKEIYFDK